MNLDSVLKSGDITLPTNAHIVKIIVLKSLLFISSSVIFWSQFWFIDFSHQDGFYILVSMHIWLFFTEC